MTNQLAEDFIKQSCDYVKSIHNYDDYVMCCKTIEDAIFERDVYDEDTGDQFTIFFCRDWLSYISQEWWEKFGDLDYKEEKEVMGYIQDVWRF